MKIDWASLGVVAVVTLAVTLVVVGDRLHRVSPRW